MCTVVKLYPAHAYFAYTHRRLMRPQHHHPSTRASLDYALTLEYILIVAARLHVLNLHFAPT